MATKDRVERRLAAIFAADIAGYSRLIGIDELGTLRDLTAYREIMDGLVSHHGGRIANTAGDSVLAEFPSVVNAVECAVAVQMKLRELILDVAPDKALRFRIGIHLGDVIIRGEDLLGDGVNVAARLEGIAEPGGICVSGAVYDQIDDKVQISFRPLGQPALKNITKPIEAYAVILETATEPVQSSRSPSSADFRQQINYCRSADGVRLAYSIVGRGPPLVKSANWLNHLELDWELPLYRHMLLRLAKANTLIRYDARGNGLSDWDANEISLEAWVSDLEAVVDAAALSRFPLFGFSQGCAVSIAYAVRHPERVSRLILLGGFATGRLKRSSTTDADRERYKATETLMRLGWAADDPTFRQLLTSQLAPAATTEQSQAFNELQRKCTSPDCAVRYYQTVSNFDIRALLPKVSVPTLILHVRDDLMVPIEESRQLAANITGAKFVSLPGKNHLILENDPGMPQFLEEVSVFLNQSAHAE